MPRFSGIAPEAMWLLAENRFRDSKEFYEEHKPAIQAGIIEPLRALQEDLTPAMLRIDPQFFIHPHANGCISRVRRDNRYTRDKSMYRENMWLAFMRDKKTWDCTPGFYWDFSMQRSLWGLGFYRVSPSFLQFLRRRMDADPAPYEAAMERALRAGFSSAGERYARPKKQVSALLDGLYNCKVIDLEKQEPDPAFFAGPELVGILEKGFEELAPLYQLLVRAAEAFVAHPDRPTD